MLPFFYDLYVLLHKRSKNISLAWDQGPGKKGLEKATARLASLAVIFLILGTCQKLAGGGGEGVEIEGGSQRFETAEKGGVMKSGPLKGGGLCKYMPVIM